MRDKWEQQIGAADLERLEANLVALVGAAGRPEAPGWVAHGFAPPTSSPKPGT